MNKPCWMLQYDFITENQVNLHVADTFHFHCLKVRLKEVESTPTSIVSCASFSFCVSSRRRCSLSPRATWRSLTFLSLEEGLEFVFIGLGLLKESREPLDPDDRNNDLEEPWVGFENCKASSAVCRGERLLKEGRRRVLYGK